MSFKPNPLSLSIPEQSFETWLRDKGYLEILDQKTTQLHHLTATTTTTTTTATTTTPTTTISSISYGLIMSFISSFSTLFSIFTLNPFAKLTISDFRFGCEKFGWNFGGFLGSIDCYSFPSSTTQARMRVHENVKRFAFNYVALLLVFFACSLYQMPLALVGLLSCLAVWELFRYCDERWALNRLPVLRQTLVRTAQCAVVAILFFSNVQMAAFCSMAVAYAVMMLHSSFRKLTITPQPSTGRGR